MYFIFFFLYKFDVSHFEKEKDPSICPEDSLFELMNFAVFG